MAEKKQALLLFCKPPVPGLVKTRLTIERGGFLSPEQAAELFRRCLYDVSEMCMQALLSMQADNDALVAEDPSVDKITYDFFVSTTPADNVELMRATYDALGKWPMEIHYITDKGATFDDHFDDAFPPISSAMDCNPFLKRAQKAYPEIPVFVPKERVVYEI